MRVSAEAQGVDIKASQLGGEEEGWPGRHMRSPYLVTQMQHAHVRVLHLEHAVLQQELAAQVIQVRGPHRVHCLAGRERVSAALLPIGAALHRFPQARLALRVWKYCSVSFSYSRGSSARISKMMVSRHPGEMAGKRMVSLGSSSAPILWRAALLSPRGPQKRASLEEQDLRELDLTFILRLQLLQLLTGFQLRLQHRGLLH